MQRHQRARALGKQEVIDRGEREKGAPGWGLKGGPRRADHLWPWTPAEQSGLNPVDRRLPSSRSSGVLKRVDQAPSLQPQHLPGHVYCKPESSFPVPPAREPFFQWSISQASDAFWKTPPMLLGWNASAGASPNKKPCLKGEGAGGHDQNPDAGIPKARSPHATQDRAQTCGGN